MNQHLSHILEFIKSAKHLSEEEKAALLKSIKNADKDLLISEFKLERTEKVKRTTSILLEETIEELELKRKAVEESNLALKTSLADLEAAKDQLVQQEKLASLGQLTAGIAHEIKNPLNFVNNFSELSIELIEEVMEELKQIGANEHVSEAKVILTDIASNLKKIHEHGSRADSIVKSMLQHSRGSSGKSEPTDINALLKEFVNLAFHGMRAGKNPINVGLDFHLDESIKKIPVVSEDFSRVIINLCNNAFDAMRETEAKRAPKLRVRTQKTEKHVSIEIEDNGPGIPDDIKDKILQPFFTTKKGTEGTGLGLSITNDIIKAHGGSIEIDCVPGEKTTFTIYLLKKD